MKARKKKKLFAIINTVGSMFSWGLFLMLITLTLAILISRFNSSFVDLYVVRSGSMTPSIPAGSLVFVSPSSSYEIGDVITYEIPENDSITVTHRITSILATENDTFQYITKGDANEDKDPDPVSQSAVLGNVRFTIPYVGYLISATREPFGIIAFIVVPALVFIATQISFISSELKKVKKGLAT